MATQEVLVKQGTAFVFKSASHVPTGNNDIVPAGATTVDLTLSSIASSAAKNSDKVDLGATRAAQYTVRAALEWFAAVTAGGSVDFYWSNSASATVAEGNDGHTSGVDAAYTGDSTTVAESVLAMQYVGSFVTTDNAAVQIAKIGVFSPRERYGSLVAVNSSGTTLCGTDDIESCVVMTPVIDDIQAAV